MNIKVMNEIHQFADPKPRKLITCMNCSHSYQAKTVIKRILAKDGMPSKGGDAHFDCDCGCTLVFDCPDDGEQDINLFTTFQYWTMSYQGIPIKVEMSGGYWLPDRFNMLATFKFRDTDVLSFSFPKLSSMPDSGFSLCSYQDFISGMGVIKSRGRIASRIARAMKESKGDLQTLIEFYDLLDPKLGNLARTCITFS